MFEARQGSGPDARVSVAEGEIDALALAVAPWCGTGRVVACGGTAGMTRAVEALGK